MDKSNRAELVSHTGLHHAEMGGELIERNNRFTTFGSVFAAVQKGERGSHERTGKTKSYRFLSALRDL